MVNINTKPISHATMVLRWGDKTIYTDPIGGTALFIGEPSPDLILLTDIHGDHFNLDTIKNLTKDNTIIVAPKAVSDEITEKLPGSLVVINNGDKINEFGFSIEAIPMYNIPESAQAFHLKGRGNGYILEQGGKRVYISGDTSNTPEMRALKNIDIAFLCMNLPYTMGVEEAAQATLAFKPKEVIPYHYRGPDGLNDTSKFKQLVNSGDQSIYVNLLNFYP